MTTLSDRRPSRPSRRAAAHRGSDTKSRIVAAAEEIVLRDGVAHLTLDAAAAGAGLSKGGVLYHFPTRDALVSGMVDALIASYDHEILRLLPDAPGPGDYTRAYLRATVAPSSATSERDDRLGAALIAAAAAEPALLEPLQRAADRWQARLLDDGLDPAVALTVRLACDGLWMCDLFGLAPPSRSLRNRLERKLVAMTRSRP